MGEARQRLAGRAAARPLGGVRVGAIVVVLGALGACRHQTSISDRNGDGHIQLLCVGDSNTDNEGLADRPKWCELLAAKHPEWRVLNGAARFSQAAGDCFLCGQRMLRNGIGFASPDVVLIALGTNDIVSFRHPPEVPVDALVALRDQAVAANVDAYIATIPPTYGTFRGSERVAEQIRAANDMLRQRLPANRLMDFHSNLTREDFDADGIHLNRAGQEKLAAAADTALTSR